MSTAEQNRPLAGRLPSSIGNRVSPATGARTPYPDYFLGWIIPAALLLVWELVARAGYVPANWLPAPTAVARTIYDLGVAGDLWKHVGVTVARVAVGFFLGASAATFLGALTGYLPVARKLLDPMLQSLRSIPSIAWVPLFLLWLGIQESSKVALISVGAFFPVYLNLSVAVRHVDSKLIEIGKLYRLNSFDMIRKLILPAVLPEYIVGLRSGLGLAWMFVVAAELLGSSSGLGYLMVDGQMTGRPAIIIASLILFALCGKASDWMMSAAGAKLLGHRAR
jgi:sulfonate transport system permease protein